MSSARLKLWIVSDLHMDSLYWVPNRVPQHDVMIIAGDVDKSAGETEQTLLMLARLSPTPLIFVPGNHDVHDAAINAWDRGNEDLLARGIHILSSGQAAVISGIRFVGATLWTDFELVGDRYASEAWAAQHMPEYQHVWKPDGSDTIWPEDTRAAHMQHRATIEAVLSTPHPGPTVVVTHHAPSPKSIRGRTPGVADASFASDLEGTIERYRPELWVHGHLHRASDYMVGDTRVVCNPRGYEGDDWYEETGWTEDLVVEI
ncbi:metallophosphoesterase [Devosia salina]|uniref:Metallophosphoesterase n=1 Tax=Devosia salina TaxID=2860336 RepID=A0ABX8WNL7_9HYPH|nr:metallophosphoesterase [Devosia salina]QYO78337.1 metallophosphoesterase [Devosia salina]